jgi:hypothetical protein
MAAVYPTSAAAASRRARGIAVPLRLAGAGR